MRRTIILSEATADDIRMTKYKFITNVRSFIRQLKDDPVNAQPSNRLKLNGYDRATLIRELVKNGVIVKKNRIADKDENGSPRTSVMKVRFGYAEGMNKEKFRRALTRMFIEKFENNSSEELNEEEGGGATCAADCNGSAPIQPAFQLVSRKMPTNEATATTTVGNYEFTAPVSVNPDDESLTRPKGSICMGDRKAGDRKKKRKPWTRPQHTQART